MELSKMIGKMRTDSGISQEKLGEILGVSRQAVQKWESGAALPDIDNIIKISRYFGLSTDAMIFGADKRATEELTFERTINPQYSTLHSWETTRRISRPSIRSRLRKERTSRSTPLSSRRRPVSRTGRSSRNSPTSSSK